MNPPNEVKKEDWQRDAIHHLHVTAGLFRDGIEDHYELAQKEYLYFIRSLLKSDREKIRSGIEALIEKVAMTPHFPGGALGQKKRFQLEILNDVLKLISDYEKTIIR